MAQGGFAVAAFRDAGQWRCEPLPTAIVGDLGALLAALRGQPPEGGPFVAAIVDDEFFRSPGRTGRVSRCCSRT